MQSKAAVREFWNAASCGEAYAQGAEGLAAVGRARYRLEPYIASFADFDAAHDQDVLEIGVGMGCDHQRLALAKPRTLTGIDLTPRALEFTRQQLTLKDLHSDLREADAEDLPFDEASFDRVYSWGVLHHSPDTARAFREVWRVLRPGGVAKLMIYHKHSITGYMLWLRYGLLAGRLGRTMREIYGAHLESPGTKAYTVDEARALCEPFRDVEVRVQLNHGDLLMGSVGQRHGGPLLRTAKALWPRGLLRRACAGLGLYLMITARK